MRIEIVKLPKEVLKKAQIIGNVFDRIEKLNTYMELIEIISSEGELFCNEEEALKVIGDIYQISHIAVGHCKAGHKDWIERWDKVIEELKKIGEIK